MLSAGALFHIVLFALVIILPIAFIGLLVAIIWKGLSASKTARLASKTADQAMAEKPASFSSDKSRKE